MRATNFDFVGRRRLWALLSGVMLLAGLAGLFGRGLDLSIDFRGGTSIVLEGIANHDLTADELRRAAEAAGATDVKAQLRTSDGVPTGALVQMQELEPGSDTERAVRTALTDLAQPQDVQVTFVGPTWGRHISAKALEALVVFLIVVVLYISIRLEFKMAVTAVVALVHDLLLTAGIYALVGFTVSPATVIALLTILGYSLYDTVVVFDRVKEITVDLGGPGRRTYSEATNTAMNQVLWRSLNTSLTSLLPVASLLFLGSRVLGATTLQDLALALFIGMASGTYSSLFVAGPLLAWWKEREPAHQRLVVRAQRREAAAHAGAAAAAGDGATAASGPTAAGESAGEPSRAGEAAADDGVAPPPARPPTGYVRGPGRKPRRKRRRR